MKLGKIIIAAVLWFVVMGFGYWLYIIIQEPVQFEQDYSDRFDATTDRMMDIKTAQGYFLKSNGKYAASFDELIASVKNDLITEIVINGNADDTSIVTTYDTLRYFIKDDIVFQGTSTVDSLKFIPYTDGGEQFDIQADVIQVQRVEAPVYEVVATKAKYLKGLKDEYTELKEDLVLGSVTEVTEKASWK